MDQLSLFPEIDDKEIRRTVARELKRYKAFKVAVQNKLEQEEKGLEHLFPVLNCQHSEKELKVQQIERAMENALDETEREIIQRKYLSNARVKDITVYLDMELTKDQYYKHKGEAISLIATALGII